MRKQLFGPTGHLVPVIGQGTWNLPSGAAAVEQAVKALRIGIEQGMVHIDTAEMYGSGESEEMIAQAITGISREKLFIVTKVLPENADYAGTIKACERSLRRLNTDYIDCYLLHWRGSHPLEETMRALEQLVEEGKIRSLGVSNFDVEDLTEAQQCLSKHPIACNQVLYHLWQRGVERRVLPFCAKSDIAVVGYTPFGQRQIPAAGSKPGDALAEVAQKHQCTARQVVLAFLARHKNTFTIPKASKPDHALENAGAGSVVLEELDIEKIDAMFPAPRKDAPLATL